MSRGGVLAIVLALGSLSTASTAFARTQQDIPYPTERVWNAAVRLLRLDLGCAITERDVEVGYVMFEYREGARSHPGSIELLRTSIDDVPDGTRVFVSIPAMPRYVEIMIAERLARKMLEEFGEPVRRPRAQQQQGGRSQQQGARREGREGGGSEGGTRGGRSTGRSTGGRASGSSRSRSSTVPVLWQR
ncbi:MAG: hypothetical protein IT379_04000 [Deltaproteobacteria bacterium]|nr:hypothetical protein [Deltaproteobacteria bacterium]